MPAKSSAIPARDRSWNTPTAVTSHASSHPASAGKRPARQASRAQASAGSAPTARKSAVWLRLGNGPKFRSVCQMGTGRFSRLHTTNAALSTATPTAKIRPARSRSSAVQAAAATW